VAFDVGCCVGCAAGAIVGTIEGSTDGATVGLGEGQVFVPSARFELTPAEGITPPTGSVQ